MTVITLQRLHLRPAGAPAMTHLREGIATWSALVTRSRQTALDYQRAGTMSARQRVLAEFVATSA